MSDARYALGFSLVPNIGPRRFARLRAAFPTLQDAWLASETDLRSTGLDSTSLTHLLKTRERLDLDHEMRRVQQAGAALIALTDPEYPSTLKDLPDAPPALYIKGHLSPSDIHAVAVVGTRKATNYGRSAARHLSKGLAAQGITIISGLAQGIDAAAHEGALEANGRTLAVLGCGIDRIYPLEHKSLAQNICQHGALITEFPLGTPPRAANFPHRNRLISGLARGVLIVEAPENSGALITAAVAAEQGREVFVVPGSIFSVTSLGAHRLIQEGAMLVRRPGDILDALALQDPNAPRLATAMEAADAHVPTPPQDISDLEQKVLANLSSKPKHIDDIARETELTSAIVSGTLTLLELKGLAQNVGHMQYCLNG